MDGVKYVGDKEDLVNNYGFHKTEDGKYRIKISKYGEEYLYIGEDDMLYIEVSDDLREPNASILGNIFFKLFKSGDAVYVNNDGEDALLYGIREVNRNG